MSHPMRGFTGQQHVVQEILTEPRAAVSGSTSASRVTEADTSTQSLRKRLRANDGDNSAEGSLEEDLGEYISMIGEECKQHLESVDRYCKTCDKMCCHNCAEVSHRSHYCSRTNLRQYLHAEFNRFYDWKDDYCEQLDNYNDINELIARKLDVSIQYLQQNIVNLESLRKTERERVLARIKNKKGTIESQVNKAKTAYKNTCSGLKTLEDKLLDTETVIDTSRRPLQALCTYRKIEKEWCMIKDNLVHSLQLLVIDNNIRESKHLEGCGSSVAELHCISLDSDKQVNGITMVHNILCVLFGGMRAISLYKPDGPFIKTVELSDCSDSLRCIITLDNHSHGYNILVGDFGQKSLWYVSLTPDITVGNVHQQKLTCHPCGVSLGVNGKDIIVNDRNNQKVHVYNEAEEHLRAVSLGPGIIKHAVFSIEIDGGYLTCDDDVRKFIWTDTRGKHLHTATESESKVSFFQPWHIQRLPAGRLLVSDHKNLYVMDSQCQVRELLSVEENTERPDWMYLDPANHRLYVTGCSGVGNRYISVYDWQELDNTEGALADNPVCTGPENNMDGDSPDPHTAAATAAVGGSGLSSSTELSSRTGTASRVPTIEISQHQVGANYSRNIPLRCRAVVNGIAVVHDTLCVVHFVKSKLWLYHKVTGQFIKRVPVPGLRDPVSLVSLPHNDMYNLLVGDATSKTLIFIALSSSLDISDTRTIQLNYRPHGVSMRSHNRHIIVNDRDNQQIHTYDENGGHLSVVKLQSGLIQLAVFSTETDDGFLTADHDGKRFVWTDSRGRHLHTASQTVTGESLCLPWHIVRVCAGHLLLSDVKNLYSVDRDHQVRILQGVAEHTKWPEFMYLDHSDHTLYVGWWTHYSPVHQCVQLLHIPSGGHKGHN